MVGVIAVQTLIYRTVSFETVIVQLIVCFVVAHTLVPRPVVTNSMVTEPTLIPDQFRLQNRYCRQIRYRIQVVLQNYHENVRT